MMAVFGRSRGGNGFHWGGICVLCLELKVVKTGSMAHLTNPTTLAHLAQ